MLWGNATALLFSVFVLSEIIGLAVGLYAVRGRKHRHLMGWVPTMHLYGPLACFAAWKAIYEVVVKPFYWDKTAHGLFDVQPVIEDGAATPAQKVPLISQGKAIPLLGQIGITPHKAGQCTAAVSQLPVTDMGDDPAGDSNIAALYAHQDQQDGGAISARIAQNAAI